MSTNKTIYIIRHGETDFNRAGIIQGSGIDSMLNDHGKWQAEMFFNAYKDIAFDKIYTSELIRTHQSVAGFEKQGHTLHPLTGLNEISWGVFEGVQHGTEVKAKYDDIIRRWRNGGLDEPIEGGESPLQMFYRQQAALKLILGNPDDRNILICMHGRAMRSFLSLILGTDLKDMDDYEHTNLCLYVVELNGGKALLKLANDTRHLF